MANRFAASDTLGFQVYNQYLNNEIARKRAEEERRKQAEQQSKAKKHNAFGQLVNTAGSVIGAGIGAATGGVPGAMAGYQMGSAGSNLLMNLFPNIGGTEPDSNNPYYNKPSDMQVANQAIGTGLQAYGQYNQYLGEQARANLADFTKNLLIDPNQDKAYSIQDLTDRIKGSKEYEDAKGIFGESVLSDNTVRQIARNAYDGVGQQAIKKLQMIQSSENNEAKNTMIENWFNRYGDAYGNMLPEGMKENLSTAVTEKVETKSDAKQYKNIQLELETAKLTGKFSKGPFLSGPIAAKDPKRAAALYRLAEAYASSFDAQQKSNNQKLNQEQAAERLKHVSDVVSSLDENSTPLEIEYITDIAAKSVSEVANIPYEQAKTNFDLIIKTKTTPATSGERAKSVEKLSEGFVEDLMGSGPTQMMMDKKAATAHIVENFGTESDLAKRMLLLIHETPDKMNAAVKLINDEDAERAKEKIREKQDDWFGKGSITQDFLLGAVNFFKGLGREGGNVSEIKLGEGRGNAAGLNHNASTNLLFGQ